MKGLARALAATVVALLLAGGCGDDVTITEEARNDLEGRLSAIGLAIAADRTEEASQALDELIDQAERYADVGQIDGQRLASILVAAEDLRDQLGAAMTTTTTAPSDPGPFNEPEPEEEDDDEGDDDEGDDDEGDDDEGGGRGNNDGNGRGNGGDD